MKRYIKSHFENILFVLMYIGSFMRAILEGNLVWTAIWGVLLGALLCFLIWDYTETKKGAED